MAQNSQNNLNTENSALINSLAQKLHYSIQQNDEILSRITRLVDTKLRLPVKENQSGEEGDIIDRNELHFFLRDVPTRNGTHEGTETETNSGNPGNSLEAEVIHESNREDKGASSNDQIDFLRNYLESNLKIDKVSYDEAAFKGVQNQRIRQLLIDNYRLLRIKNAKQAANREAFETYRSYERLLREIVIPRLSQDVSQGNIDQIREVRERLISQSHPAEDEVWQTYNKYVADVENVRIVCQKLTDLLHEEVDAEKMDRIAIQINIVDGLAKHVRSGGLKQNADLGSISLR